MIDTARQRRAQQVEAKYAADLRRLRQAKEDDLHELNERFKVLKNAYNMERIRIKEDFELRRLNLKTQIECLRDQRANLRHALSIDADTTGMGDLDDFTMRINNLQVELIGIDARKSPRSAVPSTSTISTRPSGCTTPTCSMSSRTARSARARKEVLNHEDLFLHRGRNL